jgi:hypothetical protein
MKKLLLLPVLFFILSCEQQNAGVQEKDPLLSARKALSAYVKLGNIQQQWTKSYVNFLVAIHHPGESVEKNDFKQFITKDYPEIRLEMKALEKESGFTAEIKSIAGKMDALHAGYKNAMDALPDFAAYQDPMIMMTLEASAYDADGENLFRFRQIDKELGELKERFRNSVNSELQK